MMILKIKQALSSCPAYFSNHICQPILPPTQHSSCQTFLAFSYLHTWVHVVFPFLLILFLLLAIRNGNFLHRSFQFFPSCMFCVLSCFSCVQLLVTPWTAAWQASLSFTISQRFLKLMSIESVMPLNHLVLCHPLFLLSSIFPSIRVFSKEKSLPLILRSLQVQGRV